MIQLFLKGACQGRQAPSLQTVLNSITYGNGCYRDPFSDFKKLVGKMGLNNRLCIYFCCINF